MNKQQEALKLALEALEVLGWQPTEEAMDYRDNAIDAIREALADSALERMAENAREIGLDYEPEQQQQEPVMEFPDYVPGVGWRNVTPASKPWVEIMPEELLEAANQQVVPKAFAAGAAWANAKLREKNT